MFTVPSFVILKLISNDLIFDDQEGYCALCSTSERRWFKHANYFVIVGFILSLPFDWLPRTFIMGVAVVVALGLWVWVFIKCANYSKRDNPYCCRLIGLKKPCGMPDWCTSLGEKCGGK